MFVYIYIYIYIYIHTYCDPNRLHMSSAAWKLVRRGNWIHGDFGLEETLPAPVNKTLLFSQALALQSSSRNCSPAPDLVL